MTILILTIGAVAIALVVLLTISFITEPDDEPTHNSYTTLKEILSKVRKNNKVYVKSKFGYGMYDVKLMEKKYGKLFTEAKVETISVCEEYLIIELDDKELYLLEVKRLMKKKMRKDKNGK